MYIGINYWAVLASGVAAMVIGFLWYGPLFGKVWAVEMGWGNKTKEEMDAMKKSAGKKYPQQFIGAMLMAYVFAYMMFYLYYCHFSQTPTVALGLQGVFWVWLGFIVPVKYGGVLWEGKSFKLFFIDAVYYLVQLAVMATILVAWR
jgi:Protein of unknown function (DUF1761)